MDIELMAEFGQNVQQVLIITLRVVGGEHVHF